MFRLVSTIGFGAICVNLATTVFAFVYGHIRAGQEGFIIVPVLWGISLAVLVAAMNIGPKVNS